MSENTEHTDWLNDYPVLKKYQGENPFLVPDLFFEEQQERIISAVYAEELKLKTPNAGFNVPDSYFENMQKQVSSVVGLEKLRFSNDSSIKSDQFFEEQQSIIAARIKINEYAANGSGFAVPANYFDELTDRITQKTGIKEVQQGKVRNLFTRAAWKYATAACIAVAVTTGIFVKQYQSAHNVQTQLSRLPDADIENYLKINADTYDNHTILENSTSDIGLGIPDSQASSADSNEIIKN